MSLIDSDIVTTTLLYVYKNEASEECLVFVCRKGGRNHCAEFSNPYNKLTGECSKGMHINEFKDKLMITYESSFTTCVIVYIGFNICL